MLGRARLVLVLLLLPAFAGCVSGGSSKAPSGDPAGGPKAAFSFSPELPLVTDVVRFEDTSTGSIAEWQWAFGDEQLSMEKDPYHRYAAEGAYEVTLTVRDQDGNIDDVTRSVVIGKTSNGSFRIDFTFQVEGLTVEFEPVLSPSDAVVEMYRWDFGDEDGSDDSAPSHTYEGPGSYAVTLRALSGGDIQEAERTVSVGPGASNPSRLAERSFAVIAVVDTGINPYHEEFLDPDFTEHPSSYISGYPDDAIELTLSLHKQTFADAKTADKETWKDVKANKLYWIPGTRIIGAIAVETRGPTKILDDGEVSGGSVFGHGTAVASDAAGADIGSCPKCLIVVVEGLGTAPLAWALKQDWIDVVTNSWGQCHVQCTVDTGLLHPAVGGALADTKGAVEGGKQVFFASGNGMVGAFDAPTMTYWNGYTGPDWIVTVGAADAGTGATVAGTGRPVDITSYGLDHKGAVHDSKTTVLEWSGTSAASPTAAGAYAYILQAARELVGDTEEGPHGGAVAVGEAKGFMSDGKLTRREAERALFLTAKQATSLGPIFPVTLPPSAASFAYAGYGLVDGKTAKEAFAVAVGDKAAPARANEDTWAAQDSQIRKAIWGNWNPG